MCRDGDTDDADGAPGPQLTARATILGALLGLVGGVSNLYVGLRTGLALGVVVTAGVLGSALWSALLRVRLARRPLSLREAGSLATTASAAGYSTGVLLTSTLAAFVMLGGRVPAWWQLSLWVMSVALLGALLARLLARPLIDEEGLAFPTGIATAALLRGLANAGGSRGRALWLALACGAGLKWLTAGIPLVAGWGLPTQWPTPATVAGAGWLAAVVSYTWSLELSAALVGTGAMIGWHVVWSMLLGALVCFGLLAPIGVEVGFVAAADYRAIAAWSVWPGVTWMLVGSAGQLLRGWGAAGTFKSWRGVGRGQVVGVVAAGLGCVLLQGWWFAVPWGVAAVAVVIACALAPVTARVAGQTDVVLTGPFGKLAQVASGALLPGAPGPALIGASVTAGAGGVCAALLADFKAGRLIGADRPRQFAAHLIGVALGGLVLVPVFVGVLVPDPALLGTETWPAPAAQAWRSLALVLGGGWRPDRSVVLAIAAAAAVGVSLLALTRARPRWAPRLPHPLGLGLGFILPAQQSVAFFVGGAAALVLARRAPALHAGSLLVIAGGLIAGEAVVGVIVALLAAGG